MEEDQRPHRCTTIVYYAWKIFTCLFTHVMLVTAVVAYCIMGAYMFEKIEKTNEITVKENITRTRKNVTDTLWKITQNSLVLHQENWTKDVLVHLKDFEGELVRAMKIKGWDGSDDVKTLQWTFHGALFYSIIVITTIGYGHIAPKTDIGKVATIFYAIMGIPLMLLCLSNIGDIMANSFRFLYWRICCYACTQPPKRSHSVRRGRSVRSNAQTHGVGRSRTSSLRKHNPHGSTRSADSALALSEITHSYSDTECRYHEEDERATRRRGSSGRKHHHSATAEQSTTPVLFNKYALDREESCRVHQKNGHPLKSREMRARTAEPYARPTDFNEGQYLTVHRRTPQRSSSLRQSYAARRHTQEYGKSHSHNYEPEYEYYHDNYVEETNIMKPVPIWLCMFLVISYIIGGAFLFSDWEQWSFGESAYFCFITLTTIGFGDFVPAQKVHNGNAEVSIAICSLYLLFGIALLAMSFNLVQEEVISNVKSVARNLGIIKNETEDDDY